MPRMVDPDYLDWLRNQPCACGCRQPPPCDAAHIRAGSILHDKPACTGMQIKPDDRWALPLKHAHHMAQHAYGDEVGWWAAHIGDVFSLAQSYYARYRREHPDAPEPRPYKRPKRAYRGRNPDKVIRERVSRAGRKSRPLPGTKASGIRKRFNGKVERR